MCTFDKIFRRFSFIRYLSTSLNRRNRDRPPRRVPVAVVALGISEGMREGESGQWGLLHLNSHRTDR